MTAALALTQVVLTTLAATALGSWIRGTRFGLYHPLVGWAVRTAVGFLILSYLLVALARLHLATRDHLAILLAVLVPIAVGWTGATAYRARLKWSDVPRQDDEIVTRRGSQLLIAMAIAYVAWIVCLASLPPTATDELIHHLAVPKRMLASGGDVFFADNIYAYFPPLGDVLFLFGLGVGGEMAARLFPSAFAFVLALAIYGFGRRYLSPMAAAGAVVVFLTVPSVMVIMPWAYVDLVFALYTFLALVMLLGFIETRWLGWVVLSGVMAGGAFGVKYTGLQMTMLLTLVVLVDHAASRRRGWPVAAVILPAVSISMALPFLWRNVTVTGWPLFPFPIGSSPVSPGINWDGERALLFLSMLASYGSSAVPVGPASMGDAIWSAIAVFFTAAFNDPRHYDGVVGPIFLLSLLAMAHARRVPVLMSALVFSAAFLLYWALTVRQTRFLMPLLPVLSVFVMIVIDRWRTRAGYALVVTAMAMSVGVSVRHVLSDDPWAYWSGAESRQAYLARRVPSYAMYRAANERLGPTDRVYHINMGNYGYYMDREWRSDFVFETYQLEKALGSAAAAADLAEFFRARAITHLLIDERLTLGAGVLDPGQRQLLRRFLGEHTTLVIRDNGRSLYFISAP